MTITLYKSIDGQLHYWESWENQDGKSATIHWGKVGDYGENKIIKSNIFSDFRKRVQKEINKLKGYEEVEYEYTLLIEYKVEGMGDSKDVDKRHALQDRMQEVLSWTGLGYCDGGSIGSGTMEVFCFVVDFDVAKKVIEADLKNTEFGDFTRIYDEDA
jgi:predicted DNA-binding WGR domain protein